MKNTLKQLKRVKVDSMYGKKKHFNAADRKSRNNFVIGVTSIVLNVISGSVLLYVICNDNSSLNWIPLVLSVALAFISSIQVFLKLEKHVEGHKGIGNRYLEVMKEIDMVISLYNDNHLNDKDFAEKALSLLGKVNQINQDAEAFSTNNKDYKMAQEGIEVGEEAYSENELSL